MAVLRFLRLDDVFKQSLVSVFYFEAQVILFRNVRNVGVMWLIKTD